MIGFRKFEKLFDIIGEIAAFLTITLIALLFLNAKYNFLPANAAQVMSDIREYAILGTLIVVGLEFACKRNFIIVILYFVIVAVALFFSFPALF